MPRHISVAASMLIWILSVLIILAGLAVALSNPHIRVDGLAIAFMGFVLAAINKIVFKVRTKQLEIDSHETIRDRMDVVCPSCGQKTPRSAKFCANCGHPLQ